MKWTVEQVTARGGARYYRVTNTETGETKDLWSPTTILNELNKHNINKWRERMVATGIAMRPDLQDLALTDDKQTVQEAADQALEAARSAANKGTARHKIAERITTAADAFDVAAELRPWATQYGQLLDDHGIVIKQREIVLLNMTVGYAGTADGLALHDGRKRVFDLKTGSAGWFDQSMQLSAYANAEYALVEDRLVPLPDDLDRELALVISVPAEGGQDEPCVYGMELAEAWECFKAAAILKQIRADKRGPVGITLEPTHRFSDTYVEWIRNRLAEHRTDNPAIVTMFQAWKLAAYGERPSSELTTDELEACLTALCDLEAREQVPFPTATYPHPHGPRISTETAEAIQSRIDALPQWCRAEVLAQKAKLASVDQWRVVDAEEFEQVLGPAESAAVSLQQAVDALLEDVEPALVLAVADLVGNLHQLWSWTDFDIASRAFDALADGWLTFGDDGWQINPTIVDRLVDKHGSKADATKAIRQRVADLGLDITVPRSLGDCCTDPVLVALAA